MKHLLLISTLALLASCGKSETYQGEYQMCESHLQRLRERIYSCEAGMNDYYRWQLGYGRETEEESRKKGCESAFKYLRMQSETLKSESWKYCDSKLIGTGSLDK